MNRCMSKLNMSIKIFIFPREKNIAIHYRITGYIPHRFARELTGRLGAKTEILRYHGAVFHVIVTGPSRHECK